ncbi:MAG: DNA repair protein RecO [Myxococcota bacterium]
MKTIIDRAIILENRPYKDADSMVTLSTESSGHIIAIAPNAKKSKRRFVGGFNIFSLIEFSLDKKGELYLLNEGTLIDENEVTFSSLDAFIVSSAATEVALKLFTLNNPEETAFYRLKFLLEHISYEKELSTFFNFLRLCMIDTGEIPEFEHCASCQGEIDESKILFNYFKGGILCRDCMKNDNRGEVIHSRLYRLMLADEIEIATFSEGIIRQGIFLLERYLRFKLNITFRSFYFL